MPVQVFKGAVVKLGTSAAPSTFIGKYVRSVSISYRAELLDKTAMGSSGRKRTPGLLDCSATLEFNANYSSELDLILYNKLGALSSNCWLYVRESSAAIGASNPAYVGRFMLESFNPVSGSVGELGTLSCNLIGDGKVTRITA
jgi:hypothetical protein